jgi:signal transduction histidine kinase
MEQFENMSRMLELLKQPAFAAKDGVIIHVNQAAQGCMLEAGTSLDTLLHTGREEYAAMKDGCLYLSLIVNTMPVCASVSRMDGFDVFALESDSENAALDAYALASCKLREPLDKIIQYGSNVLAQAEDADPALVAQLRHEVYKIMRTLHNMSAPAQHRQEVISRVELQNICSVLDEVFEKAQAGLNTGSVKLRYTGLNEEILTMTDTEKLSSAVYNLLSNAMRAAPEGSTVDARLTRCAGKLHLTVHNEGPGIPQRTMETVYSRYLRRAALENSQQGIGLGMAIITGAAAAHGGTVLIRSTNEGTTVTMTLDIRRSTGGRLHSPLLKRDPFGGYDPALVELSEVLPTDCYQ